MTTLTDMEYRQFAEHVEEWLLGELPSEDDAEMERLHAIDSRCQSLAQQTAELLTAARAAKPAPFSHAVAEDLYDRLMEQLEEDRLFARPVVQPVREAKPRRVLPALAAAAALLLVAAGVSWASALLQERVLPSRAADTVSNHARLASPGILPADASRAIIDRERHVEALLHASDAQR